MANYDNIPSIAVIYEGLLETFTNLTDKSEYYGRVVFITGNAGSSTAKDKRQAIWVSQDDGSNAHFLNMSDTDTIASTLSYVKGIVVGDTTYPTIEGGSYLNLVGADGIEITVAPLTGTVTFSGKALSDDIAAVDEKVDEVSGNVATLSGAVGTLIDTDTGMSARAIAKAEAEAVEDALLGKETNETNTDTIRGVKNVVTATNQVLFGKTAPVTGDKIITDAFPDVIMGQLKFGGTIGNTQTSAQDQQQLVIKTSANYKSEFTAANSIEIDTNFDATKREGWYFIVAKPNEEAIGNFGWNPITGPSGTFYREFYEVGDWFLSTGSEWVKIDNTDAVIMVAGMQGDITTASLVTELSTADDENPDPLVKESGIKLNSVTVADNSTEYITVTTDTSSKKATISVDTASMLDVISSDVTGNDALATANDVFNFIKARLSIKVVKSN